MDTSHRSTLHFCTLVTVLAILAITGPLWATMYYVAPNGADGNLGTILLPWGTIKGSVNRLVPGDTLYARGGTYNETEITVTVSGTALAPITIASYPGEKAVVDSAPAEFQAINNTAWTLYDASKNIYRSVNPYPSTTYSSFIGGRISAGGHTWSLISYTSRGTNSAYSYLASDNHNYDQNAPRYMGPGVAYGGPTGTDSYIYIRLIPPVATALNISSPYPNWYTDLTGVFNVGDSTTLDPKKYNVSICGAKIGLFPNSNYVIWDGIDIKNDVYCIRGGAVNFGNYWTYRNLTLTPGQYGIIATDNSHDTLVDNVVFDTQLPQWVAWGDVKYGEGAADHMRTCGFATSYGHYNLEIRNCTFNQTFDAVLAIAVEPFHDIKVHHNRGIDVRDDFVQLCTSSYNVEIAYNTITGAGPSHHATGDVPAGHAGTKYIHHNIIDVSKAILRCRLDPNHLRTSDQWYWQSAIPFSSHNDGVCPNGDPWKIYQNTIVFGNVIMSGIPGANLYATGINNGTGVKHEVYNNIFQELANNTFYPANRNYMTRGWTVVQPWEVFDGNLYHRPSGGDNMSSMFLQVWHVLNPNTSTDYHDYSNYWALAPGGLVPFMSSTDFISTKTYYAPGYEFNGVEADASLTNIALGDYRPLPGSAALTGAVNLSATTWPGTSPAVSWRGAMPRIAGPADSLMGYWSFDDATGTTAKDLGAGAHDGTLTNGPTWTTSKLGLGPTALLFDHINDYVNVPNHADFNFGDNTSFSISAWIRVDTKGLQSPIVMKGKTGAGGKRYLLEVLPTGYLRMEMDDDVNEYGPVSSVKVDDGAWHFVVATMDRSGYCYIYVDSGSWNSRCWFDPCGSIDDTSTPLTIGAITTGGNCYFPGAIDEVRIYNRVLTSTEIQTLYEQ